MSSSSAPAGLPVNPIIASAKRWADDADALIRQIKSSPVVDVRARSDGRLWQAGCTAVSAGIRAAAAAVNCC
jgi:hypothetical protein